MISFRMMARRGQSLLEVVIAIGILAVSTAAAFTIVATHAATAHANALALRATLRAEEGLAAVRFIRDRGWATLAPGTHGLSWDGSRWSFAGGSDTADGITRTVTVTDRTDATRDVAIDVQWNPTPTVTRTQTFRARLAEWRASGSDTVLGNWANPQSFGSIDLGPGMSANGIAVRDHIVYMAASASASAKPDFVTIDATNGNDPRILANLHTGPGLNEVAVSGSYAYVANRATSGNQLQIISVADPAAPTLVGSFTPPGVGSVAAQSVAVTGTTVLLGLARSSGRELHVIDATTPATPVSRGTLELNADVTDITIRGQHAYLTTRDDHRELVIVDITDPTRPTIRSTVDVPGGSEEAQAIDVRGMGTAYVVRTVGGNHTNHHEFAIIDITDPSAPRTLGSLDIPFNVYAVHTAGEFAFLGTGDANGEFKVYRIAAPDAIQLWSTFNFPQVVADIAVEQNIVYAAVRSNDALRIITSQ